MKGIAGRFRCFRFKIIGLRDIFESRKSNPNIILHIIISLSSANVFALPFPCYVSFHL